MTQRVWRPGEELLWTLVAHNADGILVVNQEGRISFANPAAAALFNRSVEELCGRIFGYPIVGKDKTEVRIQRPPEKSSEKSSERSSQQLAERASELPPYVAEMRVVPVDWEGEPSYLVSLRDITERNLRQQELEVRTHELELMNQEMEAFCQTVSHDLWGYSRHIEKYSKLILEQFDPDLDGSGRSYLKLLRTAAQRMKTLVEDLLQLSRVRYRPFRPVRVNLSQCATAIAEYLQLTQPEREATFAIAPNLWVEGDERQLEMVLDNLLGNAWKYTRWSPSTRIELGRLPELQVLPHQPIVPVTEPIYFVRDNGIGFDPEDASQLFVPFQRLHHHQQYEGNGVGLAIVQRIIHRHSGKIWAESCPGKGSTFYFTLQSQRGAMPKVQAN